MANPLAKVIRYLVTGGVVTASEVQSAIEQLEALVTGLDTLILDHNLRHESGGADEISVNNLSGLLADQQNPLGHYQSHENGGSDQINVGGLSGVLSDEQNAGLLKGVSIDTTGLSSNFTLQYDGFQWIVTNTLTGVTPGIHGNNHIQGGSDQITGELLSPQKAGKIFSAVINIGGLADKWVLRYDSGTSQWVAQTFNHAASHEIGQPDAIASLPTPGQKLALVGTLGVVGTGNEYVTKLDKTTNIDPYLPTANQKAAMNAANNPNSSNPFATLNDLIQNDSGLSLAGIKAFIYDPAVDKRGTPLIYDTVREILKASTDGGVPTDKPFGLIDIYCNRILAFNPGSTVFNVAGTITVTDYVYNGAISTINDDNGFGRGEIILAAAVPAGIQVDDEIIVSGTLEDDGKYYIYSIAGSTITVTRPFPLDKIGGSYSVNKFHIGDIIRITGTASNNASFTITDKLLGALTVFPLPVNETSTCLMDRFFSDGRVVSHGILPLDAATPHNFAVAPTAIASYQYDSSGDHYGPLGKATAKWIIGEQFNASVFFVDIREDTRTSSVRYTNGTHVPTLLSQQIECDASGGNIIVNLAAITVASDGIEITIKARAVGVNTITINSDAADDIDGAASINLTVQYASWTLKASYDAGGNSYWSIK
jgi:hypothetical protein